jgi:hypothetical protein
MPEKKARSRVILRVVLLGITMSQQKDAHQYQVQGNGFHDRPPFDDNLCKDMKLISAKLASLIRGANLPLSFPISAEDSLKTAKSRHASKLL